MTRYFLLAAMLLACTGGTAYSHQSPLALETKIPLGAVSGRIDHMAIDLAHHRLFVSELGNDTVGVVDLKRHVVLRTLPGFSKPQGLGYVAATNTLYVANGGNGLVRSFAGSDLAPLRTIALGRDADDIRIDRATAQVYVAYGEGGIAVIDRGGRLAAKIALPVHPEGFQIDRGANRLYANLPNADQIGVVDLKADKEIASWPMRDVRGNFPMVLDRSAGRIFVGTRYPPRLLALASDGRVVASTPLCSDADDLYFDAGRLRVYASCGEGMVDVFDVGGGRLKRIGQVRTAPGARTSLWVPKLDRLFVAARATGGQPAAILVFQPVS